MRVGALVAAMGLALVACGDNGGSGRADEAGVIRADVARAPVDEAATAAVSEAVRRFGVELYLDVAGRRAGENVAISPASVHVALGMTGAGARGETAAELDRVIGPDPADGWNGLLQALRARSRTYGDGEGNESEVVLSPADALWVQDGFEVEDGFLDVLASRYDAGLRTVDFEQTEDARAEINRWVADQTNQRIPELIPEGILSLTSRLVLTNALYLNAPWADPFSESETDEVPFHRLDGGEVAVPMMHSGGDLLYAAGDGWQAAVLPYVGHELHMLLVLPDPGRFAEVEADLDQVLVDAAAMATIRRVSLGLPRFRLRTAAALRDALEALGVRSLFDPDTADLTGINPDADLFVDAVLHETFVAVDEKGTEAAAATAVVLGDGAAPTEPVPLLLDRPFLFAIRDVSTGTLLFLGRVVDPSSTA